MNRILFSLALCLLISEHAISQETTASGLDLKSDTNAISMMLQTYNQAISATLNVMAKCNAKSAFYRPDEPNADSDGCVGSQQIPTAQACGAEATLISDGSSWRCQKEFQRPIFNGFRVAGSNQQTADAFCNASGFQKASSFHIYQPWCNSCVWSVFSQGQWYRKGKTNGAWVYDTITCY